MVIQLFKINIFVVLLFFSCGITLTETEAEEYQGLPPKGEIINPELMIKRTMSPQVIEQNDMQKEISNSIQGNSKPEISAQSSLSKVNKMSRLQNTQKISKELRKPKLITVGLGKDFPTPAEAVNNIVDGDVVEIFANRDYNKESVIWKNNNILIRGVGGTPRISNEQLIQNEKGLWVFSGNNITVENILFSGAKVRDNNGAGIRFQGGGKLRIKNCKFQFNQNGILTGHNPESEIIIEHSEFSSNGYGDGRTHNLYIGRVKKLTFQFNISHHAHVGHNLKSRAESNIIQYNQFYDGSDGDSSYSIDISNGGEALIVGNIIQQGPNTENWAMLSYGAEGLKYNSNMLTVAYNTFINNRKSGVFVRGNKTASVLLANNIFYGRGEFVDSVPNKHSNILPGENPRFKSGHMLDGRLGKNSPAINRALFKVKWKSEEIFPNYQLQNGKFIRRKREGNGFDIGAVEYVP